MWPPVLNYQHRAMSGRYTPRLLTFDLTLLFLLLFFFISFMAGRLRLLVP